MKLIGFGDVTPRTIVGRNVFLGFVLVGVGILTFLLSITAEILSNQWRLHIESISDTQ
jgi:hypothetical protein